MNLNLGTYVKKYSSDNSKKAQDFIIINENTRMRVVNYAFNNWRRVLSNLEVPHHEYLGEDGLFIVDTRKEDANDLELHSLTEAGLGKMIKKLDIPFENKM